MRNNLLDLLLDRLLTPPDVHLFSWLYALRLILITAAIHASGLIIVGITEPMVLAEGLHFRDVGNLLFAVSLSVLPYWAVFVLAVFSDENKPGSSWRVWAAWLVITYPFAGLYLMMFFGDRTDAASGAGYAVIAMTALSPVFTVAGAVAGYLLWLLYRWLLSR